MALTKPKLSQNIDTDVSVFSDPILVLHQGSTSANLDVGFLMNRSNGLTSNAAVIWQESTRSFVHILTNDSGASNSNLSVQSYANVSVGNVLLINNAGIYVDGTLGSAGQVLASDGSKSYWATSLFNGGTVANTTIFESNLVVSNTTSSTSNVTGALVVLGGIGTTGNVFANVLYTYEGIRWAGNGNVFASGGGSTFANADVKIYLESLSNVNIGLGTGIGQGTDAVAIGIEAGNTTQSTLAIAIGPYAGNTTQGEATIAIGSSGFYGNGSGGEGYAAGGYNQGGWSVAIGTQAGAYQQSQEAVAIGDLAGTRDQGYSGVAVGWAAGQTAQGYAAVAVGPLAGQYNQGGHSVAIGQNAATNDQGEYSIALGHAVATTSQGNNAIAIGYIAAQTSQGQDAIAIGTGTALSNQGTDAVAIGTNAGALYQGNLNIAIGAYAGNSSQKDFSIAIGNSGLLANIYGGEGYSAGGYQQGTYAVAIGSQAGAYNQNDDTVAIGSIAGVRNQSYGGLAVGSAAGQLNQGQYAVALGYGAGQTNQLDAAVAIGRYAGQTNQAFDGVAIGNDAGYSGQGEGAIAIGRDSASSNQSTQSIAIGYFAGVTSQGYRSVAIGAYAGFSNQAGNSIIISANGQVDSNTSGFFVDPVRNISSSNVLYYNSATKEITFDTAPVSYSNTNVAAYLPTYSGNIQAGNLLVTGNISAASNVFANIFYVSNSIRWAGNGAVFASGGGGGGSGTTYTAATTPPTSGNVSGDMWYNTSSDILYEYLNDGTNSYWVDVQSLGQTGNITTISDATLQGNIVVGLANVYSIGSSTGFVSNIFANNITTTNFLAANILSSSILNIVESTTGLDGNLKVGNILVSANTYRGTSNISAATQTFIPQWARSATPPSNPQLGDKWYDTSADVLYEYSSDGVSSAWVDTISPVIPLTNFQASTTPPNIANSRRGDLWYDTSSDALYTLIFDGTSYYWVNYSTLPAITLNAMNVVNLTSTGVGTFASINVSGLSALTGVSVSGSMTVTGTATLGSMVVSSMTSSGTASLATMNVSGVATFTNSLQVQGINEKVTVVNSASTGTINFNASDQSILYYTQNATANWTVNVRGSASRTLNSIMSAGQSLTLVYMATQGGTAFIPNAFSIDGVSVTPKFSGGAIWTGGNASSIDVYTYNIFKISDATFTVLAGQSTYK